MEKTRAERKLKKRKLEEAIPEIPGDIDAPERNDNSKTSKKPKKPDQSTKNESGHSVGFEKSTRNGLRRSGNGGHKSITASSHGTLASKGSEMQDLRTSKLADDELEVNSAHRLGSATTENDQLPQKSKKERKAERKTKEAEAAASRPLVSLLVKDADVIPNRLSPIQNLKKSNDIGEERRLKEGSELAKIRAKVPRFIVFVGNLPFSATTEAIQKHLAPVHPQSVRHLTSKSNPSKSRGYAFVEFNGYDHMKACLKTFHHSLFSDGISEARKINVELTAGGGGNKANRKAKIGGKNQKLNEERVRRMQGEVQTRLIKKNLVVDLNNVHPSRRTMVPESR